MELSILYMEELRIERELKNLNLFSLYTEKVLIKDLKRIKSLINKEKRKLKSGKK